MAANYLKATITRFVYWHDVDEVELLRYIDTRLLTTSDLKQALENVLTTMCELLRSETGFIANVAASRGPRLETSTGDADQIEVALSNFEASLLHADKSEQNSEEAQKFIYHQGFWYIPLQTPARDRYLGLLGVQAKTHTLTLTAYEERTLDILIKQAEFVLEDRRLQQNVFKALRGLVPEIGARATGTQRHSLFRYPCRKIVGGK